MPAGVGLRSRGTRCAGENWRQSKPEVVSLVCLLSRGVVANLAPGVLANLALDVLAAKAVHELTRDSLGLVFPRLMT